MSVAIFKIHIRIQLTFVGTGDKADIVIGIELEVKADTVGMDEIDGKADGDRDGSNCLEIQ